MSGFTTSRRAILAGGLAVPALVAIGAPVAQESASASSEFDAALRAYHTARDADEYDREHGALGKANALHNEQSAPLLAKYGRGNPPRSGPDADRWKAQYEAVHAAEEKHTAIFGHARWAAAAALLATPAPTVAALLLKTDLAIAEGDVDALAQFIRADIARLAAEEV